MSAGFKLYNPNSQLLIDGSYSNICLCAKILATDGKVLFQGRDTYVYTLNYSGDKPLIVLPLDGIDRAIYTVTINNGSSVIKIVSLVKQDFYVYIFDEPNKATPANVPALKIYSDIDGHLVFDSRLKYLKVAGDASPNRSISSNRNYGYLMRDRSLYSIVVNTGVGSTNIDGYYFLFASGYHQSNNQIATKDIVVWEQYYSDLSRAPAPSDRDNNVTYPLLIDLTNY